MPRRFEGIGARLVWRSRTSFRTTWQGQPFEVMVACGLPDKAAFRRDVELIAQCARTFEQVKRDLDELGHENVLLVSLSRSDSNGIRAEMRSAV